MEPSTTSYPLNPQGNGGCRHSLLYLVGEEPGSCGLCFLKDGYETETPTRIHAFKVLAENGNPESSPRFVAHLETVLGLVPPKPTQNLRDFRLARVQLNKRLPGLSAQFPITVALVEMMGLQPPLAVAVIEAIKGVPEFETARRLGVSLLNVQERTGKGVRLALRLIRDGRKREAWRNHPVRSFYDERQGSERTSDRS